MASGPAHAPAQRETLARFFQDLPAPIDHVLVTAGGPSYGPLLEMDSAQVREAVSDHIVLGTLPGG